MRNRDLDEAEEVAPFVSLLRNHGWKGVLLFILICLFVYTKDNPGWWNHVHLPWSGSYTASTNTALILDGDPKPSRVVGPYQVLTNLGYVSGYDDGIQDPLWVETRFFSVSNPESEKRPPTFTPDDRVPAEDRIETSDYARSGYDRGHMAPNWGVSICYGRDGQMQTFFLTNVIPQTHDLNAGLWETLEKIISNDYAERFGAVWVISGPIFSGPATYLHDGKIRVPDGCYKIVARQDSTGHVTALAFEMPQLRTMQRQQSLLPQYLVSISKIEQDTGITFFSGLSAEDQASLKATAASGLW